MTLDDMFDALRSLGKQRWVQANLGLANTGPDRMWEKPFDVHLAPTRTERWLSPDHLALECSLLKWTGATFGSRTGWVCDHATVVASKLTGLR